MQATATRAALDALTVTGDTLPALGYAHRTNTFDATRIETVRNCHFTKPEGGAWLSPVNADDTTEWQRFLHASNQPVHVMSSVSLRPDARVLRIDSLADLTAVVAAYPPPPALNESIANVRGFDFEAAARDFDAVWLTQHGLGQTQRTEVPNLMVWDIESVLILTRDAVC